MSLKCPTCGMQLQDWITENELTKVAEACTRGESLGLWNRQDKRKWKEII